MMLRLADAGANQVPFRIRGPRAQTSTNRARNDVPPLTAASRVAAQHARRVRGRSCLGAAALCALLGVLTAGGCAADRALHVRIGDDTVRPRRAAVVFFVDGFGQEQFDEALASGRIPNIKKHLLGRGTRVQAAVTCIPSITYAASVSMITGRQPGHHGVVSNKWLDPSTGKYQNYSFIKTYQQVDGDYSDAPTIYDVLHDRITVSVQTAIRRGVTHAIDNWATSGINWFFGNVTGVDALVAQRLELIADLTPSWGRWPDLIWFYFPGADNIGHQYGPGSSAYAAAIANIDRQIGHVCDGLCDVGMYDQTHLCLIADHGMAPVDPSKIFDVVDHLRRRTGSRVWSDRFTMPEDQPRLLAEFDYAAAVTASRWAAIYPLARAMADPQSAMGRLPSALAGLRATMRDHPAAVTHSQDVLPDWLAEAVDHPAVELAVISFQPGTVHVFRRNGYALIERSIEKGRLASREGDSAELAALHQEATGADPGAAHSGATVVHTVLQPPGLAVLEHDSANVPWKLVPQAPVPQDASSNVDRFSLQGAPGDPPAQAGSEPSPAGTPDPSDAPALPDGTELASDSRLWLAYTVADRYPDFVPQIVDLFDSPRAGNIVLFAAEGWDFSQDDPAGGHGSILPTEMRIPMLFAGPGIDAGATIPYGRLVDLAPTVLHLLGAEPVLPDGSRVDMDGIPLLPFSQRD